MLQAGRKCFHRRWSSVNKQYL